MTEQEKKFYRTLERRPQRDKIMSKIKGRYTLVCECYVNPDPKCDPREKSIFVLNIRGMNVFDDEYEKFENGADYKVQEAWDKLWREWRKEVESNMSEQY